jgi:hypothetical protein
MSDSDSEEPVTLLAYCTVEEADTFFYNRLNTLDWDDADDNDKARSLNMATSIIERLNFTGDITDSEQDLEFPRDGDIDIPQCIKDACCMCALKFLEGYSIDDARDEERISSQGYGSVRQSTRDLALPYLAAGIPSAEAWDLLLPYLVQGNAVHMDRIS